MIPSTDTPRAGSRTWFLRVLAAACALGLVAGDASARTTTRPKLTTIKCVKRCSGSRTVAPGGTIRLRGKGLTRGMKAVFRARSNAAGIHAVLAKATGRVTLTAKVPADASSGRVYVKKGRVRSNAAGPIVVRKPKPSAGPGPGPGGTGTAATFQGTGMWIWYVSQSSGGDPNAIVAQAKAHGVTTVFVKAGDGTSPWAQFNPQLVGALKAGGLHVCAWQYVYGTDPAAEAAVAAQSVSAGADCFVIDAEKEYEGRYAQAQTYINDLRGAIGPGFPVGLASFPYVDYHPALPYSVFLGPSGAQFDVPQVYWKEIGGGVDAVVSHTYRFNRPYNRTIAPLGQLYDNPPTSDIVRFRQLAQAEGSPGLSWWDWQEAQPAEWDAIGQALPPFGGPQPATDDAVLGSGGKGDLVVWAQELLNGSGQNITVDGQFGPATQQAVQSFQTSHGLSPSGQVDTPTWNALLAYPAAEPNWATSGVSPATAGRRTGPKTAKLRARRYEIAPHLGSSR